MVLTVCVGKEIPTEDRKVTRSGSLRHSVGFVHSIEVVCEGSKLSLEEGDNMTRIKSYSKKATQKKSFIIIMCGGFIWSIKS